MKNNQNIQSVIGVSDFSLKKLLKKKIFVYKFHSKAIKLYNS